MIRNGKLLFMIFIICIGLYGCGKKKVDYQIEEADIVATTTDANVSSTRDVKEQLGLDAEEKWEEKLHYVHGEPNDMDYMEYDIDISAEINIPETDYLYTATVQEWYLSPEDKERILKYFADESSIVRNIDQERTKENYQSTIDEYTKTLKELEESGMYSQEYLDDVAGYINTLEERKQLAPAKSEIKNDVNDYSGVAYWGEKNGNKYSFYFTSDEDYNRSQIFITRTDGAKREKISQEQAVETATEICAALGIEDMVITGIHNSNEGDNTILQDNSLDNKAEALEYTFYFSREIDGIATDTMIYEYEDDYSDALTDLFVGYDEQPYGSEMLEMVIDSNGLRFMIGNCLAKDCVKGEAVRLLSMDKIKEVYRNELLTRDSSYIINSRNRLDLIYLRVTNPNSENEHCYIPVWRLSYDKALVGYSRVPGDMFLFVNAMDGSVIDLKEVGAAGLFYSSYLIHVL